MFDKFKQLNELRKMQSEIKKQKTSAEKDGVKIVINGGMQVEQVTLNPEVKPKDQEKAVKEAFNEAVKKIQKQIKENVKMPF